MTYLLWISYKGTRYAGFQVQPNVPTVCAVLQDAMQAVFGCRPDVKGCSRTDAGVHARGQVVNFYGQGSIPTEKIPYAMKGYLPPEIAVLSAKEMPDRFSVRHDNVGKHYRYSIDNNRMHDPFLLRYAWFIRKPLDRQAMREGAAILLGTHDFSAFEGQNTTPMNPVKTMYSITLHERGHVLDIDVVGDGFLYHMVRNIAGGLVDLGLHRLTPDRFRENPGWWRPDPAGGDGASPGPVPGKSFLRRTGIETAHCRVTGRMSLFAALMGIICYNKRE